MKKRIHTAVRISPDLKESLQEIAEEKERSMNYLITQSIVDYINKEKSSIPKVENNK